VLFLPWVRRGVEVDEEALEWISAMAPKAYTTESARRQRALGTFEGGSMDEQEHLRLTPEDLYAVWGAANETPSATDRAIGLAVVALAPAMPRPAELMRFRPASTPANDLKDGAQRVAVVRYKTLATTGALPNQEPIIPAAGWTSSGHQLPFRAAWTRLSELIGAASVEEFARAAGGRGTQQEAGLALTRLVAAGGGTPRRLTLKAVRKAAYLYDGLPEAVIKFQLGHKPEMTTRHYSAALANHRAGLITRALDKRPPADR